MAAPCKYFINGKTLSKEQFLDYVKKLSQDEIANVTPLMKKKVGEFKSSHFEEKNILVHIRHNTRTDANGNKVLFLEEVQSDWGQKGKKEGFGNITTLPEGYRIDEPTKFSKWTVVEPSGVDGNIQSTTIGQGETKEIAVQNALNNLNRRKTVPAPFVTDTNAWTKLGLKVALKEAVKQGADRIAWSTGTQQFDRWGSEEISWRKNTARTPQEEARMKELGEKIVNYKDTNEERVEHEKLARKEGGFSLLINEQTSGATAFNGQESGNKDDVTIQTKDDLRKAIKRNLSRERNDAEIDKLTDRIWNRMQTEDSGTSLPRKEGMEGFYGVPSENKLGIVGNVAKSLFKQEPKTVEIGKGTAIGTKEMSQKYREGKISEKEFDDFFKSNTSTQHSIDITPELKASVEGGQPLFKDAEAQYRIENGKNIVEAIKDFNGSPRATVALTHEIMHPTVVAIIDGAKDGNEVGAKHTETIVSEFNKANPKNKVTTEQLIEGNDAFKDGTTSKQYRAVQEFIAKSWEKYHKEGGKGFSAEFQKVLDQITKAFQSVYKSLTGKQLTPELRKMFDDILGKEQSLTTQSETPKEETKTPSVKEEVGSGVLGDVEIKRIEIDDFVVDEIFDWQSPIDENTTNKEEKIELIKNAYDNKSFDEAFNSGRLSMDEVEEIITSAGLPEDLVDKIMFRVTNPELEYDVISLAEMKVNNFFQQLANYYVDNGSLKSSIVSGLLNLNEAKFIVNNIKPVQNEKQVKELIAIVDEEISNRTKQIEENKKQEELKYKGYKIGDLVGYQNTRYEIKDIYTDTKGRFKGFIIINTETNVASQVLPDSLSEWTSTDDKIFNLKKELGESINSDNKAKPVESNDLSTDRTNTNLQYIPFDIVSKKGVEKESYDAILAMAKKFSAMFPYLKMTVSYFEDDTKGSLFNNVVTINLKNATADTPIHEVMHPFVVILKQQNINLYNNLLNEFKNSGPVFDSFISDVEANIFYNGSTYEQKIEEAFVEYLGNRIQEMHDNEGNFIRSTIIANNQDDIKALEDKGYVIKKELKSTLDGQGRSFKSVEMYNPKLEDIQSNFFKKFMKWFNNFLNSLFPKSKAGNKKVSFTDWNLAKFDYSKGVVYFYKPAKNRAESVVKKDVLDKDNNVIGEKVIKTSKRDQPSLTIPIQDLQEELKLRGASESEISEIIEKISIFTDTKTQLSISLENSYISNTKSQNTNNDTLFFSNKRVELDVSSLPVEMTINDLTTLISYGGDRMVIDLEKHQDMLSQLEAYQYTTKDVADDLMKRTEQKLKLLIEQHRRIGLDQSSTVKSEYFALKELLNKYKDIQFIQEYIRQGIGALNDANKIIQFIKDSIKEGATLNTQMNQVLQRDLREAEALISFYDNIPKLLDSNEHSFKESEVDFFNSVMTRSTRMRGDINTIVVDLTADWLFPTLQKSEKLKAEKDRLSKDDFKKNIRAASADVDFLGYWMSAVLNSKDPLTAVLGVKIKEELIKNYEEESTSLQRLRVLYDNFLKKTGISNTSKSVEIYYKENFLRKAKIWELINVDSKGVKEYGYVERWAFHEQYLADVHADFRRLEVERLKTQLGEPNNYEEREIFNERLSQWDLSNPLQSNKFLNPAFSKLNNNEYYSFLYDRYKKSNIKYGDKQLDFGIIPQAYNKTGTIDRIKKTASYVNGVLKGNTTTSEKARELLMSAANSVLDKDTFEKIQSLNLDGTYFMSVKSPFTHLLDEEDLSFDLNESVHGFYTSANQYSVLKANQANIENLKLLLNGNVKLGIAARKVLKTKIKTRNGKTGADLVFDTIQGMPPQDKEQSEKKLTKQLNAYINDTFYGVSEYNQETNIGPVTINFNKIGDNLGFATAALNMAGNLLAGVSNLTIGNVMSLGESFGGKYYTPKDWAKAQGMYFKELLSVKFFADVIDPIKSKVTQLGIMYDAIQGEFRDKYGKNITGNILQRYFTKDSLFILNHIAEHQIQLTGMLALMNSTKVKLKDGSEIDLYNAYVKNDKGFYKMREDAIWTEDMQLDFIKTLHGISRDLNGNYAANDKAMLQRYTLGKLALQYRKYLYTAWRTRVGSKRYDYERGTTQEGYYRGFLNLLWKDIKDFNLVALGKTLVSPNLKDNFTKEEAYSIRKTRFDIMMLVGLQLLTSMLASLEAADDEDDKYVNQLMLLWSLRLRSDLSSYTVTAPQELSRMIANPSASFNTVKQGSDLLNQLFEDISNGEFETYQKRTGNNQAGDYKVVSSFEKLVPLYRQWLRLQSPQDQLKYYDLINKNVEVNNQ